MANVSKQLPVLQIQHKQSNISINKILVWGHMTNESPIFTLLSAAKCFTVLTS